MSIFIVFVYVVFGLYCLFVVALIFGWFSIPQIQKETELNTKVSLIIPVRNEEKNITNLLQNIDNQTYGKNLFEVLIINDHSTDTTVKKVNEYISNSQINIQLLHLGDTSPQISRKKAAITLAIKQAKGDLIMCTDGDCTLPETWIKSFVNYYESTGCKFISGPVTFFDHSIFAQLQIVEFSSLIGTGAASVQLGRPNMCNGANLAYEKAAYFEVNGFEGFESIVSGDDEFLMHKIAEKFPDKIGFLKSKDAIVTTYSQNSLSDFINQRKRWASKWDKYLNVRNSILAIFIFMVNFFTAVAFVLLLFGELRPIVQILLIKLGAEFLFISSILAFLGHPAKIFLIPIVQLIYPFYVVFTSLISLRKGYIWKGIKYK